MRTSHKAKDAAAEKQSYVCDTFTGHGKAHQPPLPGSPVCVFPVMLLYTVISYTVFRGKLKSSETHY